MIVKDSSWNCLQCDFCSYSVSGLEDFNEAVQYKKENGWRSVNKEGKWYDKCPSCQEDGK